MIQFSGYVAAIEASYTTVFSNKVKVHFKKDVSQSTIKKLVEQLNFTLVRHSQEDKYSIISLGGDFLDDLSDCIEKIYQTGLVDLIFPLTIATFPVDSIPNNFLWKGQYDHVIIEVKDAWTILEAANGSSQTFGTGDIIVGVTDDGLTPKDDGGVYTQNASFTGTVIEKDGTPIPKIFKLQDFRTASFGDNNNTPIIRNGNSSTHGVNVCGIISASPNLLYGTAGVTGNSQLLSFIIQNVTATQQIQAIRWGAGIKEYIFNTNTLPKLAKGFDLLACSIAYNYTSSMSAQHVLTDEFADLVKDVLLIARNGRGALMVFSAGNENSTVRFLPPPVGGSASNRFSAYENVLSIGATSFYPDYLDSFDRPIERKAVYSNFGKIDFCAPSSNGGRAYGTHDPVRNIGTWTPTIVGKGDLPGLITIEKNVLDSVVASHPVIEAGAKVSVIFPKQKPLVKSTSAISASATSINVEYTTDFRVGMTILIVNPLDNSIAEYVKISGKTATSLNIDSSTPIVNNYAIGSYIYPYPILISKITAPILDGSNTISVDYVENFTINMWIEISDPTDSISDYVKITNISGNTLTVLPSVTNPYNSLSNTHVKALATLLVADSSIYNVNQFIEIENISQGMTQIYSDLPVLYKIPDYIIVDNLQRHTLENNSLLNIRKSALIHAGSYFNNDDLLPANYNPISNPSNTIGPGSSIMMDDTSNFVEGTMIHIETIGGNSEWTIISSVDTDKLNINPNIQFDYPSGESTTIKAFPTLKIDAGADVGDFLEIQVAYTEFVFTQVIAQIDKLFALNPINKSINPFQGAPLKRVFPVKLDNISGLSDGDTVLLGKPEFNLSTKHENSEVITIDKVDSIGTRVFARRIVKEHSGTNTRLYKGNYDYTSYFGGTSSACPIVGGVIGLMLSANPDLTWAEIIDILRKTSDKIDPNCRGYELPVSDEDGILDANRNLLTYRASDVDETKRPAGAGRWKNKACEYILNVDGTLNPAVTDTEPYYSEWYGYGRVNAKKAVQGALNYDESQRDLMIRDTLTDEGTTDNIGTIHSPDIWIQHIEVNYTDTSINPKPDFSKAPPHENPNTDSDRYIYARVKNKGELLNNLECTVRFYIALCDGTNATGIDSPFLFPDDWSGDTEVSTITSNTGIKQTYFVGEKKIHPDEIIPGGGDDFYNNDDSNRIVSVKWNEVDVPPSSTNLKTYLLIQVSPHDGSRNGLGAESNGNLSFREIVFADFQFKKLDGGSLPNEIEVDGLGTETSDFEIEVKTPIGNFITEDVEIIIERHNASGVVDNVTFKYNSTNSTWELKDGNGATPSWSTMSAPVETGTSDPASGVQTEIKFSGSYTVDKQFSKVRIKAVINSSSPTNLIDIPIGEGVHDVAVYEAVLNPGGLISSPGQPPLYPQSYTFTNFADLNTQPANLAFGPSTGNEANKFRVTSSFTASTDVNAYAMVNGFVMIQPGAGADKVNLILRPFTQPIQGFNKVKYIIYRGLRLDEFIDINDTTKVVAENSASNSEWITQLYATHHNLNPSGDFLSKALGYDPSNQSGSDLIDDYFFSTNADFQLPFISRGAQLGKFFANGGSNDFGIDIILEDRKFTPNLDYVRTAFHEIDITGLPTGTDAEKFTKRIKQDEILNFMDLAAFYGIHHTEEGKVRRRNGSNNTETIPLADLYSDVIDKFATRNAIYIDVRNELGDSLNFFTNYNDGSGNQIQLGTESGTLAPMAYQTHGWPILIKDNASAPFDTDNDFNEIFLQLRVDDNLSPMLFVKHGDLSTSAVKNKFVEGDNLISGTNPWTNEIGLTYPNTGTNGAKLNVSWFLKLNYSRKLDSDTVYPDTVVQTNYYADNLFGSIDAVQPWDSSDTTQWTVLQPDQYVDGSESGFGQVSEKGIAVDQAQSTDRVIMYTNLTDDFASSQDFTPNSGQTSGTNQQESFLAEPMLFKGYNLDFNIINSSPNVTTLRFKPNPDNPISEQNTQILGLTKNQLNSMKSLNGYDNRYPRTVVFDKLGDFTDTNGKPYSKFKLGVNGLDNNGHYLKQFPATDLEVYSLDELLFTSADFANLEPTPTEYTRDTEENNGAKLRHPAKTLMIDSFDADYKWIAVKGVDARQLSENEKVTVSGSSGNDGIYTVNQIINSGIGDTVIEVKEIIPNSASSSSAQLSYPELTWEDYFIRLDQNTTITNPPDKMETIVANFTGAVNAAPNNETAPGLLETAVNTYAPMILNRARAFVQDNSDTSHSNLDDRILYWARIKMLVTLKSHSYLLGSITDRDRLVEKFEELSRGYSTVDFGGTSLKKILITGFDPFQLDVNEYQSNPSGACALALHGKTLGGGYIQTMMIPVRYKDFDGSDNRNKGKGNGIVEKYIAPFIGQGANHADIIITLSQSGIGNYNIDRFSTINRGGASDNLSYTRVPNSDSIVLNSSEEDLIWIETTLPKAMVMNGGASQVEDTWKHFVVYAQHYSLPKNETSIIPESPMYDLSWDSLIKNFKPNNPAQIFTNTKKTDNLFDGSNKKKRIIEGSGSDYLSNEIFYRVALARERWQRANPSMPKFPTGHFHIAKIQESTKNLTDKYFISSRTIYDELAKLIETVKERITLGVNNLNDLF